MMFCTMGLWLVSTARYAWIMALYGLWLLIKGKASVKWCVVFLVCAVWIGLWKFNTVSAKPIIGIVWEHKENSYLVNNGVQTVWVMNKEKPPLDSIVEVVGPVKEFHSMENGLQGTLERYAQSHHIAGYTYAKSTVISEVHTLRKLFYSHLSDLQNEFVTEMIAGRTDNESTVGSILISSGMHVSYVLSVMTSLLGLFLDEKKVKGCRAGYLFLAGILYRHKFFWYRLIIQEIASYITRDRKQKFNIQWMILICLFPRMTTEYAFVIPLLFGFLAVYGKKNPYRSFVVLSLVQCCKNGKVPVLQMVLIRFFQQISAILWFGCLCSTVFYHPVMVLWLEKVWEYIVAIQIPGFAWIGSMPLFFGVFVFSYWQNWELYRSKKALVMVILSIFLVRMQSYINPFAKITYLDVGQGDCTLIQLPFHTGNILIDTGGMLKEDLAKTVLVPYLNGKGISELDMVVITHDDFDHNGALESLKELMPIDCVVTERQNDYTVGNFRMLEVSEDQTGDTDNDTSLTCWYQINNLTFLQCGDLGKQKEDDIIKQYNITCDVLKLSHHGSDSSSSSYYLSHLQPQIAIVSSGYQNTYHHPSTSVTDNLRRLGIPYLNTAEEGAIHIIVGRWIRFFYTERGMFGIIKPGDKR